MLMETRTRTRIIHGELHVEEVKIRTDLTDRELEVLALMAEGASNKAIAGELWLSPHTVQNHLRSIFRKLKANNRTQAALAAYRLGVIEFEAEIAAT